MLMPDNGASIVMKQATSSAASSPVNRAALTWLDAVSTTSIITNEIAASAANATVMPCGPGIVAM